MITIRLCSGLGHVVGRLGKAVGVGMVGVLLGLEWAAAQDLTIPLSPDEGGPRSWQTASPLQMHEAPSERASVVERLVAGSILDNLGCRESNAAVWCDVQPLGGGARGYVLHEGLAPAVGPDGSVAVGPDDSALRAGEGRFDATGFVPCAQALGQPMTSCAFGVARAGGGYATIVLTRPDGRTRALFFRLGRAVGADTSEADGSHEFLARREGDLNLIRVGDERYEIPDAVVLGG